MKGLPGKLFGPESPVSLRAPLWLMLNTGYWVLATGYSVLSTVCCFYD